MFRAKDDKMNLRKMRIADFTGAIYGASRKMQEADDAKASVSFCMTLCGIALNPRSMFLCLAFYRGFRVYNRING